MRFDFQKLGTSYLGLRRALGILENFRRLVDMTGLPSADWRRAIEMVVANLRG